MLLRFRWADPTIYQGTHKFRAWTHMGPGVATPLYCTCRVFVTILKFKLFCQIYCSLTILYCSLKMLTKKVMILITSNTYMYTEVIKLIAYNKVYTQLQSSASQDILHVTSHVLCNIFQWHVTYCWVATNWLRYQLVLESALKLIYLHHIL